MSEPQAPYKPNLIHNREAWTAASMVIAQHGSRAREHALGRIAALREQGDGLGVATWGLILSRIEALEAQPGRLLS